MKHILLSLICLFTIVTVRLHAQKSTVFLFTDFVQGTVTMKNGTKVSALLNYDAANSKMMFKQGNDLMILTGMNTIDTVYIDNRKFFPVRSLLFLESVTCEHGTVYINWQLRSKYQGQKGAYGQVSHAANVESINTSYWTNSGYKDESLDVYKQENNNEYWLERNGKFVKCKNQKSLLKLFPEYIDDIKEYINNNNLSFNNAKQVVMLLDYCLSLDENHE